MSFFICGNEDAIVKIAQYVHHYSDLMEQESLKSENLWVPALSVPHPITLTNKYYVANLLMTLLPISNISVDVTNFEGIVLVATQNEENFKVGVDAAQAELGLRLLVSYDHSDTSNQDYLSWAIDHGFEYIEIFGDRLMESHGERDKIGLPRLMEALESNMWSTMERKQVETHDSVPEKVESLVLTQSTEGSKATPFEDEVADASDDVDDDMKMFEDFATMMAQARMLRDKAVSGNVSDAERRENAAAFALKLSAMMDLDADSEEDS